MQRVQTTLAERKPSEPQLWGPYFKMLRKRRFTRPQFIQQYLRSLDNAGAGDELYLVSEAWLARIERGDTLNTSRDTLEFLCSAVGCSATERLVLLALADRNFLVNVRLDQHSAENLAVVFWLVTRMFEVFAKLLADGTSRAMLSTMLESFPEIELSDADVLNILIALREAQDEQ